jgi:hypothetical protein
LFYLAFKRQDGSVKSASLLKLLSLVVLLVPCLAAENAKPQCNAKSRGTLWPAQANTDPAAARKALRCGELQMCTAGTWKYRWEPMTVSVSQLATGVRAEVPGCSEFFSAAGSQEGKTAGERQVRSERETGE